MMNNIINAETARLAGLQIDFLHKYRNGKVDLDEFEKFINLSKKERQKIFGIEQEKSSELFSGSLLQTEVVIQEGFSLDKNIVPRKEFKYGFVSDYARDEYFTKQTISGKATLNIVSTTRNATTKEIAQVAKQQDALAIISTLHKMLVENPHSLDQFKDRAIVVPVLSLAPHAGGFLFCLHLYWRGDGWYWYSGWVGGGWGAGVRVALLAQ